jgi:hypothetical protein
MGQRKEYTAWTKEFAEKTMLNVLAHSNNEITFFDAAKKAGVSIQIIDYITNKYNFLDSIKKEIILTIENNIVKGAMNNNLNATMTIFNLKNNFGWKDKTEVENTVKLNTDIIVDGKKITE